MLNDSIKSSSIESTTAKIDVITKIPTITPNNERNVLSLFTTIAPHAKDKLS